MAQGLPAAGVSSHQQKNWRAQNGAGRRRYWKFTIHVSGWSPSRTLARNGVVGNEQAHWLRSEAQALIPRPRRPSPRSPASSGDGKKTQGIASVPIENCLTKGVQRGGSSVSFPIFTNRPHITSSCTRERAIQVRSVRIRGRITTSSLSAIRPQSASFNWSFQLPEPDLSFPMRSSYWRQYESDGDMRISAQLAQMRAPPVLASGGWNVKQSSAAD